MGAGADQLHPAAAPDHRRPGLLMMARGHPAHYVMWDLLAGAGGHVVINAPLFERRTRLAELLECSPAHLTLTPQTTDMDEVAEWLTTYTVAGIEGVVIKRLDGRYEPGWHGWQKFRLRGATEAIIGGVTGSPGNPSTLLLGRFDRWGHLRYTGRTHPAGDAPASGARVAAVPAPAAAPGHPCAPLAAAAARELERAAGPTRATALREGGAHRGG